MSQHQVQHPLKPKQRQAALLAALLYDPADIAAQVGYSTQYIVQLLRRSDIRELTKLYQEHYASGLHSTLMQSIMADAPTNLERIKQLRDQHEDERVALSAASLLFERQVPKVTKHEEERHIHVHLSREEEAYGASVLAEAQAVDALLAEG